ncbi:MAG: efflux RND transporter periplasmic adaptor subunit [Burkholderiaceae bacterium]|nr:efflux RND transporter periplasmic adaptor subunit [Burkholderiaceae bacterium]
MRIQSLALGCVFSLFVMLGAKAAYAQGTAPKAQARPALTVTVTRAQTQNLAQGVSANGTVAAWQEASIGAEIGGLRLTEVRVNVGDQVKAGQVLAVFAADNVLAEINQAKAAMNEAKAVAAEAQANADRARALQPSGVISAQQFNQSLTAEATAKARVESAQALMAVHELRLRQTQVKAPDSGVISSRSASVGAVVGLGTELFRQIRGNRLEWRADMVSSDLFQIKPGQKVHIQAAAGGSVTGTVRMVGPTVDGQNRTGMVYVDLPTNAMLLLKPGMYARGDFEFGSSTAALVPQQSVVIRDGFSQIFVVQADQRVKLYKVNLGRRQGEWLEVTSGLPAEANVVVRGAGFLTAGDLVKVVADTPAVSNPAAAKP